MLRTHETVFQRLGIFYLIFDSNTLNNFVYFFRKWMYVILLSVFFCSVKFYIRAPKLIGHQ